MKGPITKTYARMIPNRASATPLEKAVALWLAEKAQDYGDKGLEGVLSDLAHGGGSSGMISHLIYTGDCVEFYQTHQKEIDARLYEALSDSGAQVWELFKDWDKADPLAREDGNQNILAWFGFEEMARNLGQRAGIEL